MLYFHSLASIRESWVSTAVLKNSTLVRDPDAIRQRFFLSPEFRQGQSSLEVMTENGILIYSDIIRNSIVCWNTATEPIKENTQVIYEVPKLWFWFALFACKSISSFLKNQFSRQRRVSSIYNLSAD